MNDHEGGANSAISIYCPVLTDFLRSFLRPDDGLVRLILQTDDTRGRTQVDAVVETVDDLCIGNRAELVDEFFSAICAGVAGSLIAAAITRVSVPERLLPVPQFEVYGWSLEGESVEPIKPAVLRKLDGLRLPKRRVRFVSAAATR